MTSTIAFDKNAIASPNEIFVIGLKSTLLTATTNLSSLVGTSHDQETAGLLIQSMLKSIKGKSGKLTTFLPTTTGQDDDGNSCTLTIVALSDKVSRNNHPLSPHYVSDSLSGIKGPNVQIYVMDEQINAHVVPMAAAIARVLPLYDSKSKSSDEQETEETSSLHVSTSFLNAKLVPVEEPSLYETATAVADGTRLAAWLGDMPPAELTTDRYAEECRRIVKEFGDNVVTMEEIVGEDLNEGGYGGIYGVGKAAECPPRMVIMKYVPKDYDEDSKNKESIALVGKGIVYDTGGLSLKGTAGMAGMKHDCGGSAGVLAGFRAAVQLGVPQKITLYLGIAENAIGPRAVRNDDILTMYSGKTVEVNNTDAEGRLVLADCVAHASKHIKGLDVILDMATLTGAQLVATGKKHAAILANTEAIEKRTFEAGMASGDLVYPILYAPELLRSEFASKVADMKNSVKDRGNAQCSCAGHFIESHIDASFKGDWVHVDMAGPDLKNERATGYGVALVLGLLGVPGF